MGIIIKLGTQRFNFLSNFYKCNITIGNPMNLTFDSAEAAYQALKSENPEEWKLIQNTNSPGSAKNIGRKITLRNDWEHVKKEAMYFVLSLKFKNEVLKKQLIDTYPHTIVEGNYWHDNYWGVCYCNACPGVGENMLGVLLMTIRKAKVTELYIKEQ